MSHLPKKTLSFKSTTSLSINERFTQLRGSAGQATVRQARDLINRENNAVLHQASIKNRRLAQQMERRPTVVAALKIKKKSIRQRLGPFDSTSSVRSRLQLPGASGISRIGGLRGRGQIRRVARGRLLRGRASVLVSPRGIRRTSFVPSSSLGIRRGSSIIRREVPSQRLNLSTETVSPRRPLVGGRLQVNRRIGSQQFRSSTRGSRLRGSRSQGIGINRSQFQSIQLRRGNGVQSIQLRRGNGSYQPRGNVMHRNRVRGSGFRGTRGNRGHLMQQRRGQFRRNEVPYVPRGQMRGQRYQRFRGNQQRIQRGSFRGFRRNQYDSKPSKEELDNELDQYMSNTQSRLDHQLDSYMRRDSSNSWH